MFTLCYYAAIMLPLKVYYIIIIPLFLLKIYYAANMLLLLDYHIIIRLLSHITKLLNYQLHSLRLIRHSISISTATIIASAYILPQFEYSNFIIYNIPSLYITKLQILQNSIARYIFNIPKYSHTHISPFLYKLH